MGEVDEFFEVTPKARPLSLVTQAFSSLIRAAQDIFEELSKYGTIEDLLICSNSGDHLNGNVLVMFSQESQAEKAVAGVSNRFYGGICFAKASSSALSHTEQAVCSIASLHMSTTFVRRCAVALKTKAACVEGSAISFIRIMFQRSVRSGPVALN
jgi:hypothetical protein